MPFDEKILELNNEEKLKMFFKFYDEMSDVDFKERLKNAGFEIVEGIKGQIFLEEETFIVSCEIKQSKYSYFLSNSASKEFDAKFLLGVA